MKRNIVTIDPTLCDGCGLCVSACHEGALKLVDGKARLVSESYCDGLGDCLPECPTGAIKIVEREAAPFDAADVAARQSAETHGENKNMPPGPQRSLVSGCPGKMARTLVRPPVTAPDAATNTANSASESRLVNWPVQLKLAPVNAPYLRNAALLIAADCTAFAYPDIHRRFMTDKVTLIGCPKLDDIDYTDTLTTILQANDIRSVTVLRMEVPCCAGLANAVRKALLAGGKNIPWHVVTIATDGMIVDE